MTTPRHKQMRGRNIAVGLLLVLLVMIFFAASIVKMQGMYQ